MTQYLETRYLFSIFCDYLTPLTNQYFLLIFFNVVYSVACFCTSFIGDFIWSIKFSTSVFNVVYSEVVLFRYIILLGVVVVVFSTWYKLSGSLQLQQ